MKAFATALHPRTEASLKSVLPPLRKSMSLKHYRRIQQSMLIKRKLTTIKTNRKKPSNDGEPVKNGWMTFFLTMISKTTLNNNNTTTKMSKKTDVKS